ncbi:MAG: enoyl-CoA hydratase/isomerase family protein [Bacteroidia bacterium]|nr:MAG: enoyl-CoA hydratase/isomerase family protein [Bacteroidia bacterium]
MAYTNIEIEKDGLTATLWLSRADKRNAINQRMAVELLQALSDLSEDTGTRVLFVRGRGPAFCAGADLGWMTQEGLPPEQQPPLVLSRLFNAFYTFPKPMILLAHGRVMGGAMGLLAGADFVLAEEKTVFAFSEVRLGLIPATISPFVIRRMGEFKARQFMLSGIAMGTNEALASGLIDTAGSEDSLIARKDYLCEEILSGAPDAVKKCKELIIKVSGLCLDEDLFDYTTRSLNDVRRSEEAMEGWLAFREKRDPEWKKRR